MLNKLILFTILALAAGCRTIHLSEFRPEPANAKLLPALDMDIDMASLESAYWGNSVVVASNSYDPVENRQVYMLHRDIRIQDAVTLYERETRDNITNPIGQPYGFIYYKIPVSYIRHRGTGLFVLSSFMLMLPNVLGLPFGGYEINMEVEVEILNSNREVIGRYTGLGKGAAPVAFWWGYTPADAQRISNVKSIKAAMNQIKQQINRDYEHLQRELLASGPVVYR
jgi:hypothetical protein